MEWMGNYIPFYMDVITYICPDPHAVLYDVCQQ